MRRNYQQDFQTISMERKNTVKKYSQPYTFQIYFYQERVLRHSISPNQTVGTLIKQVKQKLSNKYKKIIGLTSVDGSQLVDYTLKMKSFPLTCYQNNMNFALQIKQEAYSDQQPTLNDFQFLKLLGSGISSSVYLVRHKSNGILYALKQISKEYFREFKRIEQVLRQRKIMIDLLKDIPFTTKLYSSFQSQKFLNLLIEYYPGGQMFVHLQKRKLKENQAKLYFAEMILTFQKLHSKKIIYRDLKPENIMIDFQGHARLGDYGMCKLNLEYYDLTHSYCGSQEYMAPQIRLQNGYNYSVDFYTLGSFVYQLVNGVPPYYNGEPLVFANNATEQFKDIVQRLIDSNMHQRLRSFQQIKRMKWMKGINWRNIQQKQYQMPFRVQLNQSYIGQQFKRQQIPVDAYEQNRFDKLLDCFFFLSPDKGGISQFYGARGLFQLKHKKNNSIQKSHNRSRKSEKSRNSSSKNQSISKKKESIKKNLYTSQPLEYQKKKLEFSNKSNSKNVKTFHDSIEKQKSKSKKLNKDQVSGNYASQKLTMKKVKSGQNIHQHIKGLQKIFSPVKMTNHRSPQKYRF